MEWVEQPQGVNCCGQVALAVLTGLPLDRAISQVGHSGRTKTATLVRHLRAFGYDCPSALRPRRTPPELALAKLTFAVRPNSEVRLWTWHWVVIDGPRIWDGMWGSPDGTVRWPEGARITSYLPLRRKASLCS